MVVVLKGHQTSGYARSQALIQQPLLAPLFVGMETSAFHPWLAGQHPVFIIPKESRKGA